MRFERGRAGSGGGGVELGLSSGDIGGGGESHGGLCLRKMRLKEFWGLR